jgi:tetratricopeptide (TPR) repeat protein
MVYVCAWGWASVVDAHPRLLMSAAPNDIAARQALLGRVLGDKYKLTACIGLGGTGAVYRADQIALGRTVAVKILSAELATDARLVKRFRDEAMAASRLNHPNTVSIIDYGQSDDALLYLVMEHLRGPTLTQLITREHPLPLGRVLDIVVQILSGIEEAHLAGVVHADLKSDNIIVDQRRAGADVVKIVDFGIARLVHAPRDGEDRTVCGTPEYMAPEVITGAPPAFAADLYAVGIILYELLVAQTPFVASTTLEILNRQVKAEAAPLAVRRPDLTLRAELDAVLARALAKAPVERFPSAAEMREAIVAIAARQAKLEKTVDIECASCGARCAPSFRFCPECGHPSGGQAKTLEFGPLVPAAGDGAALTLPMTGRERELATVRDHLRRGRGGLLVHGPIGAGRTRLVREACVAAAEAEAERGLTIFQTEPDPTGMASTYYPIRALVAAVLDLPGVCSGDELHKAITGLGLADADWFGVAQLFGHWSPLLELEPPIRRRETLTSALRVIQAVAARTPMAIVFDDIDRYDAPSIEILRRLADLPSEASALPVVMIGEPTHAERWPVAITRLALPPLPAAAIAQLAQRAGGLTAGNTLPAMAQVVEHCGGLPGHLEHLLRYVGEGGQVEAQAMTLPDLLAARLAMLPHSTLQLCQAAAVLGLEAPLEVVRATARIDDIDAALVDAEARGLLQADDVEARFLDPLVRDVTYAATPADVRRSLHQVAARTLEDTSNDVGLIGHHLALADDPAGAQPMLTQAGDLAARQLDDEAAARLYQRALVAVRVLVQRGDGDDSTMRDFVELSVKLAEALRARGEAGLARGVLAEARAWADSPGLDAQLDRGTAALLLAEDELDIATATLRRAIGKAIATGATALAIDVYVDLAGVLARMGEPEAANRELGECIDVVTLGEGPAATSGPPNLWEVFKRKALLLSSLGDQGGALQMAEAALGHASRVRSRLGRARSQALVAQLCESVGRRAEAERHRAAAVEEMRKLGDRRSTADLLLADMSAARSVRVVGPRTTTR